MRWPAGEKKTAAMFGDDPAMSVLDGLVMFTPDVTADLDTLKSALG